MTRSVSSDLAGDPASDPAGSLPGSPARSLTESPPRSLFTDWVTGWVTGWVTVWVTAESPPGSPAGSLAGSPAGSPAGTPAGTPPGSPRPGNWLGQNLGHRLGHWLGHWLGQQLDHRPGHRLGHRPLTGSPADVLARPVLDLFSLLPIIVPYLEDDLVGQNEFDFRDQRPSIDLISLGYFKSKSVLDAEKWKRFWIRRRHSNCRMAKAHFPPRCLGSLGYRYRNRQVTNRTRWCLVGIFL